MHFWSAKPNSTRFLSGSRHAVFHIGSACTDGDLMQQVDSRTAVKCSSKTRLTTCLKFTRLPYVAQAPSTCKASRVSERKQKVVDLRTASSAPLLYQADGSSATSQLPISGASRGTQRNKAAICLDVPFGSAAEVPD